jgi:YesN/AraC family two-component response regulator
VEALEMIHKENFDLLISDIKMPQMDGLELLKKVRADDDIFDIPVILLTAMNSIEKQLQSMRYGADDYIPKPFSPALLIGRSIALIQQRDKLRQAYTQTKGKDDETLHPSDNNQQEANAPLISSERDRKFREIIDMKIQKNLSNPDFVVDDLAQSTGYGRSQFYSKMLEITGKTPKEYIREQRMTKAAQQLRSGHQITVAEVAYQVGFSDPLYFSRCFKQYFGMTPSKYQKG